MIQNQTQKPIETTSVDFNRFRSVRSLTEEICQPLQPEDMVPQPVAFASPPKWHLAHTTWFFEEFVLKSQLDGYECFHDDFSYLFNSYYNTVGKRVLRANRGNLSRPGVEEVYQYRRHVDQAMNELMNQDDLDPEVIELIELGLHHEQQHQELLYTDLKYILGHNPVFPVYRKGFSLVDQSSLKDSSGKFRIDEGVYEIGFSGDGFHYDNELGRHKVYLHAADVDRHLVTNGEFVEFIEDGGYQNHNLWLDEGWAWVNQNQVDSPLYWHRVDGEWWHYQLSGFQPLDSHAVLGHVSYYEAWAFAQWKQKRLPTEFEWEVASDHLPWGTRWEWTESAYLPYPGFRKADGAIGEYNGKFMINTMVLRGASTATSPNHSRSTYRNFFHPNMQWQVSGIRLAESVD